MVSSAQYGGPIRPTWQARCSAKNQAVAVARLPSSTSRPLPHSFLIVRTTVAEPHLLEYFSTYPLPAQFITMMSTGMLGEGKWLCPITQV